MPALGGGEEEEQSGAGEGGTTQKRPSNVDDARAGAGAAEVVVQPVERKYTSRRLCMSASVLGAGVHGIGRCMWTGTGRGVCVRAWAFGVSGVSNICVEGVGGVGGSEGRSDAPEKVSRPSEGSYIATKVSAV